MHVRGTLVGHSTAIKHNPGQYVTGEKTPNTLFFIWLFLVPFRQESYTED